MADYSQDTAAALAMIREAGKEFDIYRSSPTFEQTSGLPTDGEPTTGTITAVILPARKGTVGGFDRIHDREGLVKANISYMIAGVGAFVPELLDEIDISGTRFLIRGIGSVGPDGTPIIYKFGLVAK